MTKASHLSRSTDRFHPQPALLPTHRGSAGARRPSGEPAFLVPQRRRHRTPARLDRYSWIAGLQPSTEETLFQLGVRMQLSEGPFQREGHRFSAVDSGAAPATARRSSLPYKPSTSLGQPHGAVVQARSVGEQDGQGRTLWDRSVRVRRFRTGIGAEQPPAGTGPSRCSLGGAWAPVRAQPGVAPRVQYQPVDLHVGQYVTTGQRECHVAARDVGDAQELVGAIGAPSDGEHPVVDGSPPADYRRVRRLDAADVRRATHACPRRLRGAGGHRAALPQAGRRPVWPG